MTLSPLTMTPVSAVLLVQPTPLPWSARQAQMWSRMTLSALTSRLTVALPRCAPPMRKNTSWSDVGSSGRSCGRVARPSASCAPDLEQHRRVHRARVEDEPGDHDALTSATVIGHDAVLGGERRHAQPEHDRACPLHLDRLVDVVDARREDEVLAVRQRLVDRLRAVRRLGDEEALDRDRPAGRLAVAPRRARGVELHVRDEDVEVPVRVDVEERLLARDRVRVERRVRRVRERLRRRALDTGEDLVPDAVAPAVETAVPDQVLLLRAVDDAAGELRVGDEAAAGEGRGRAVVHERGVAVDVDPPHR